MRCPIAWTRACMVVGALLAAAGSAQAGNNFASPVKITLMSTPSSGCVGDFNGDGWQDLIIGGGTTQDRRLAVMYAGPAGLSAPSFMNTPYAAGALAAGDFNRDGTLDLAVQPYYAYWAQGVGVYLGQGGGAFGSPVAYPGSSVYGLKATDVDGDGIQDLLTWVGEEQGLKEIVYQRGLGNGTFGAKTTFNRASEPQIAMAGDVTGDGIPDIVVANYDPGNDGISVLPGKGGGAFGNWVNYSTDYLARDLIRDDFNRDGRMDVIVGCLSSITCFTGQPDGTLGDRRVVPMEYGMQSLVSGDFNLDGMIDLAFVNYTSQYMSIVYGDGLGGFGPMEKYALGGYGGRLYVGDFDGNGAPDIACTITGGAGYLDVLYNTVPEPGTIGMCACLLIVIRRRR